MPRRRLEDRIRDLCCRATEPEWPRVLAELRLAIHEHALRVANLTIAAVVGGQPEIIRERRERQGVACTTIVPTKIRKLVHRALP